MTLGPIRVAPHPMSQWAVSSKGRMGRAAFGLMAAVLMLAALGTAVIARQIDNLSHPFFPEKMLEDVDVIGKPRIGSGPVVVDLIEEGWYPGIWRELREPSLYLQSLKSASEVNRTLRFTWVPSFHPAVTVRVDWLASGAVRMTAKRSKGAGGYGAGGIDTSVVRILRAKELSALEALLISKKILDQPPVDKTYGGLDGSRWIIESSFPNDYRYVNRWSPHPEITPNAQPMYDTGIFMLGLTGWNLDPIY